MNTGKVVRFRSRDQILTRRMAHVFVEDIRKILYGGVPSPTKASSSTWEALRRLKDHDEHGADLAIIAALAALPAKQHEAIGPLWAALDALEIQDEDAAVAALDTAWAVLERDRLRDCAS